MKPLVISFAFATMALALPCGAQTSPAQASPTPGHISPEAFRALAQNLFQHRISGHRVLTPQEKAHSEAILAWLNEMDHAGAEALRVGDFVAAEYDFRESLKASPWPPGYYGLAEALTGQGRTAEAIEAYRGVIYGPPYTVKVLNDIPLHGQLNPNVRDCPGGGAEASWMKYALLLSQTGQGAEAVVIYKKALPQVPDANHPGMSLALDSDTPAPENFQAAAHMALGLCATYVDPDHDKAMTEFDAAWRLRPDLPLTNYYYGYGWRHLDPKSPAKSANAAQAKAALQQAAASGEGEVKKAAQEALRGLP